MSCVTFDWMTCVFIPLPTLQFVAKLQKSIRNGMTVFKIFIWEGILSDIWSEIKLKGSFHAQP